MQLFCLSNGNNLVITSAGRSIERNKELNSTSDTHVQGRAMDISVREWSPKFKKLFINHFSKKYGHLGALSGKKLVFMVVHGKTKHIHVQVHRKYKAINLVSNE